MKPHYVQKGQMVHCILQIHELAAVALIIQWKRLFLWRLELFQHQFSVASQAGVVASVDAAGDGSTLWCVGSAVSKGTLAVSALSSQKTDATGYFAGGDRGVRSG